MKGSRPSALLIVGGLAACLAALAVAILFDSPTSTTIISLMALAAAAFTIYSGTRQQPPR